MSNSSITKNFIYNILLTLSTYLAQLVVYPYVSRVLGVDNMGVIGFVNKTIDVFLIFSTLGIQTVGIREIAAVRNNRRELDKVFSSLVSFALISTLVTSIVYLFAILWITKFNIYSDLFLVGLAKLIFSTFLIEWLYQGLENFRYITIRSVCIKLLYVLSVFLFVKTKEHYYVFFVLTTVVVVINSIINWVAARKYVTFKVSFRNLKSISGPLFTFGAYQLLNATFSTFNYLFLGFLCTKTEVGYYYTAENFYFILLAVISAFTRVMLPRMSSLLSENKMNEFNAMVVKSFDSVLSVCLPIAIYGVFFAANIIFLFSGAGYEGAVIPLQIMMALVVINAVNQILIIQIATPLRLDKEILIGTAIATVVSLPANYFLSKQFGSIGCAVVLVISVIVANMYPIVTLVKKKYFKLPSEVFRRQLLMALPYVIISSLMLLLEFDRIVLSIIAAILFAAYYVAFPGRSLVKEYMRVH